MRAPARSSTSSVGRLKHSDLPDAVPVVTIVGPARRRAAPAPGGSRGARCPPRASAASTSGWSSGGRLDERGRGSARSLRGFAHQPPVLASLVQQRAPRLGCAVEGHGLEIVEAMSATDAERWAQARSFHHSLYPARADRRRARAQRVGVPARARVRARRSARSWRAGRAARGGGDRRGRRRRRRLGGRHGGGRRARRRDRAPGVRS